MIVTHKHMYVLGIVRMYHCRFSFTAALDKAGAQTNATACRNGILGRESTPEEAAGLADGSIMAF